MKIVRYNTFETNSSSTHSLVIPHVVSNDPYDYSIYDSSEHNYQFGREEYRHCKNWDEKLAYTYYVLNNYVDRYNVREEDEGYGSNIKVTEDDLNTFKDKVREAYKEVIAMEDNKPYRDDPTPDDIFYIIDNEDKMNDLYKILKPIKYKIGWDEESKKNVIVINEDSEGCDYRDLTSDEELAYNLYHKFPELFDSYGFSSVYVDHTEDFGDNGFIEKIISADKDYIKKFIFHRDSYINIGGDEYMGYNIATIGFEYDYPDSKYPEKRINEAGLECPDSKDYEDFDEWWEIQKKYPIITDNGGFHDRLREYEKDNDVFLKGN